MTDFDDGASPFDGSIGSVWQYNSKRAQEYTHEAIGDTDTVFLILEGTFVSNEDIDREHMYRNALDLLDGSKTSFTKDSRLNKYSERLF